MVTLELCSYELVIPNGAYTTLSQFLLAVQHSVDSTIGCYWLMLENDEKGTLNIYMSHSLSLKFSKTILRVANKAPSLTTSNLRSEIHLIVCIPLSE